MHMRAFFFFFLTLIYSYLSSYYAWGSIIEILEISTESKQKKPKNVILALGTLVVVYKFYLLLLLLIKVNVYVTKLYYLLMLSTENNLKN